MNNRLAIYILSVVAIALGVVSCGRTGISKSVVMADSLSQSDPAAAMAFIDSITARNENMSTDSRMRLGLLRTKAQNSAGVMFTSDSVMRNIVEYYESEGDADDRMLAYYLMGSVYRDLGDSPLALQYFNKAAEQAIQPAPTATIVCYAVYTDRRPICSLSRKSHIMPLKNLPLQNVMP